MWEVGFMPFSLNPGSGFLDSLWVNVCWHCTPRATRLCCWLMCFESIIHIRDWIPHFVAPISQKELQLKSILILLVNNCTIYIQQFMDLYSGLSFVHSKFLNYCASVSLTFISANDFLIEIFWSETQKCTWLWGKNASSDCFQFLFLAYMKSSKFLLFDHQPLILIVEFK